MHRSRLAMLLAAVAVAGCGATKLSSSWRDPEIRTLPYRNVVVFVLARDATRRRIAEDAFVSHLPAGVTARPSYAVVSDSVLGDIPKLKARLLADDAAGAVIYRLVGFEKQTSYVPPATAVGPSYAAAPYYGGFGPYWGNAYAVYHQPGYLVENKIVQIECAVYDVATEKLVWSGRSDTLNPVSAEQVIDEVVVITLRKMREDGVLP